MPDADPVTKAWDGLHPAVKVLVAVLWFVVEPLVLFAVILVLAAITAFIAGK